MIYLIIPCAVLLVLLILYLLALRPNTGRQAQLKPFEDTYIAHRGFFNNKDIPENSLAAFAAAVRAGYGIELDVRLTADDQLVVFHDESLKRMCGDTRILHELTYEELCKLSLLETDEKIPLLKEALDVIGGAVPLVVEIKSEGGFLKTAELTNALLQNYHGIYCIESFHPSIVKWYKDHNPGIIRGQLSMNYFGAVSAQPWFVRFLLTNLLYNFLAKPDFIAYHHVRKNQFSYRLCRKLYHPVNAAWTIRSQAELEAAKDTFTVIIFDSFTPNDK